MNNKFIKFSKVILPAIVLGAGLSFLFVAFAQPSNPPAGNPFPPINTAPYNQIKFFNPAGNSGVGAGFLGLDYLKAPTPVPSDWAKKAGSSTLCSDPSGKIIICRTYIKPSVSISIARAIQSGQSGFNIDEEKPGAGVIREYGMTNDVDLSWSVTKNTNSIDISPLKSIIFSKSPSGASLDTGQLNSNNQPYVTSNGASQTGTINNTNTYSAQNINSSFSISVFDILDTNTNLGGQSDTASAGVVWNNKIYCGADGIDYISSTPTTYATLPSLWTAGSGKFSGSLVTPKAPEVLAGSSGAASQLCTFQTTTSSQDPNGEYEYFLIPKSFGVAYCLQDGSGVIQALVGNQSPQNWQCKTVTQFENKHGYKTDYYLYRSPFQYLTSSVSLKPVFTPGACQNPPTPVCS